MQNDKLILVLTEDEDWRVRTINIAYRRFKVVNRVVQGITGDNTREIELIRSLHMSASLMSLAEYDYLYGMQHSQSPLDIVHANIDSDKTNADNAVPKRSKKSRRKHVEAPDNDTEVRIGIFAE